jgi:branched-chain amino acid aminotransferase
MMSHTHNDENYDPNPNLRIWRNGEFLPTAEATVSVFDHGLLYGDGVFEGIRSYSGRIFEKRAHVKRFFDSMKGIRLEVPFTPEQIAAALDEALEQNGLAEPEKDAYIRMVATRGVGVLGISPLRTWKPQVFIIAASIAMYPEELYRNGMPIITSSITRNSDNAMPPRVKSLNYLNNILAKLEAHDAGVMEAVMLNAQGHVAEATGDNLFIVRDGQLQTPPSSAGILEGVTRGVLIRLAREMGIEVVEKTLVRMDLYFADEMFLCGTGAEVIGVISIDRRQIGNGSVGPITRRLINAYRRLVRAHVEQPEPELAGMPGD